MKRWEQVYGKQRGRETWKQVGAFDIKCIYTQACFFFLPSASSFGSPPPLFLRDCLKWAHVHSQAHVIVPEYMSTEPSSSRTLTSLMLSQEADGKIKLFWFVAHGAKSPTLLPTWDTCYWLKVWKVLDKSTFEKNYQRMPHSKSMLGLFNTKEPQDYYWFIGGKPPQSNTSILFYFSSIFIKYTVVMLFFW